MPTWLIGTLVVFGALVTTVLAMRRLARWAGQKGWVYNTHNPRPKGVGTLGFLDQIYHPGIEHVIEERSSRQTARQQEESGDKPESGSSQ